MEDREAVSEKVRAVGLIYQQSVEGDSRDPENKKGHQMVTFIVPEYGYSDFNFSYDSFIFWTAPSIPESLRITHW